MRREELSSLTGIRFYAALLVYLYHVHLIPGTEPFSQTSVLFNAGAVGVSFFFVLSGFILTYNYADAFRDGVGATAYRQFVWDRLTKIYPVHVLTVLVALPLAILSPHLPLDWRAVPVHLLLLQCFWPSTTPAFSEYLNVPSWSISCEWFFYLVAPLGMFCALGARRRWIPVVVTGAYVAGLVLVLWHYESDATRSYFVSRFAPSRFVEFLAGIFAARVFLMSSRRRLEALSDAAQAAGLALVVVVAVYGQDALWPVSQGLLCIPGSVLLVLGLASGRGLLVTHLSRRALNRLGTASFSLYLIHVPILRIGKGLCLRLGWSVHSWLAFWAVVIGMFVVAQTAAFLIFVWYEVPMQARLRSWLFQQRLSGAAGPRVPRYRLLVARDNPELADLFQAMFANEPRLEILVDRRVVERRCHAVSVIRERRRMDRRAQPQVDAKLKLASHTPATRV